MQRWQIFNSASRRIHFQYFWNPTTSLIWELREFYLLCCPGLGESSVAFNQPSRRSAFFLFDLTATRTTSSSKPVQSYIIHICSVAFSLDSYSPVRLRRSRCRWKRACRHQEIVWLSRAVLTRIQSSILKLDIVDSWMLDLLVPHSSHPSSTIPNK